MCDTSRAAPSIPNPDSRILAMFAAARFRTRLRIGSIAFASILSFVACSTHTPRPGGGAPDGAEEERLSRGRKEWFARMHKAAPGVDWRAIERENGERAMERRRASFDSPLPTKAVSAWKEVGSSNQAGRMHCVSISEDKTKLYSGSSLGGIWRGNIGGGGWEPLSDNLYGGVHELITVPSATLGLPEVMVTVRDGNVVRRSIDDGATWTTPAGLSGLSEIRGIFELQDATHTIVFLGRLSSSGAKTALFASTDRGATFVKRWNTTASWSGFIWVPRTGAAASNTIWLVHQGALFRSTDSGASFSNVATIDATASQAILCGSEAGGTILYGAMYSGGDWKLYRSTSGGASFALKSTLDDYWGSITASILNPDIVIYGGVESHRSTNGGASFSVINTWGAYYAAPSTKLHADIQGIECFVDPVNPSAERWYFCTDGGTYHSTTSGATVNNLSLLGLGVSQYYSTHTSKTNPNYIQAGAQDQGYQRGSYVAPSGNGPATPFNQIISGDYGHLTSGDDTHATVFSNYPGFFMVVKGETSPSVVATPDFPAGASYEWIPPLAADRSNPNDCFFGANRLYRYVKGSGNSWSPVQHSNFDFGANGGAYLTAIAVAPTDVQRMYAVNAGGKLFYSTNHGVDWAESASSAPGEHYFYGNAFAVHPTNALEAVVGGSGYSTSGVRRTTDGGITWSPLGTGMPATHFYDLAYDGDGNVFAGAETGAWMWDRATGAWSDILGATAPITLYWSVEYVPGKNVMRFGTYGRGIWDYDLGGPSCSATITSFGTGCAGSGGFTPVLAMTGCPSPGDSVTLSITKGLGGSTSVLFLGIVPLALPLGGNCQLHPQPLLPITISLPLAGSGAGNGAISVPATIPPGSSAGQLVIQAFVPDSGVPMKFSNTNALILNIQ